MEQHLKTGHTRELIIVDGDTGEELDRDIKRMKYLAGSRDEFFLIFSTLLSAFMKITQSQIRVFSYLLAHHGVSRIPITKSLRLEIYRVTDVNERVVYNALVELEKKHLIYKHEGLYQINPRYAYKGSTKDRDGALKAIIELGCSEC